MMKMINHRNIVKLKEVLASNSKIYLVLELIKGGDLFDVIKGRYLITQVSNRQGWLGREDSAEVFLLDFARRTLLS